MRVLNQTLHFQRMFSLIFMLILIHLLLRNPTNSNCKTFLVLNLENMEATEQTFNSDAECQIAIGDLQSKLSFNMTLLGLFSLMRKQLETMRISFWPFCALCILFT